MAATYVLVPESEFKRCQKQVPDFDQSVAELMKKPFKNDESRSEALKNALIQYQYTNHPIKELESSVELIL